MGDAIVAPCRPAGDVGDHVLERHGYVLARPIHDPAEGGEGPDQVRVSRHRQKTVGQETHPLLERSEELFELGDVVAIKGFDPCHRFLHPAFRDYALLNLKAPGI